MKKVRNVYVVMAVSGMYEDQRSIAAYLERTLAAKHALKATQWWVATADSLNSKGLELSDVIYTESIWKWNPWDGSEVYMIPEYTIVEIPLRGSVRPVNKRKAGGKL